MKKPIPSKASLRTWDEWYAYLVPRLGSRWAKAARICRKYGYELLAVTEEEQVKWAHIQLAMRRSEMRVKRRLEPELRRVGLSYAQFENLRARRDELGKSSRSELRGNREKFEFEKAEQEYNERMIKLEHAWFEDYGEHMDGETIEALEGALSKDD
jgi:hypothetical protein